MTKITLIGRPATKYEHQGGDVQQLGLPSSVDAARLNQLSYTDTEAEIDADMEDPFMLETFADLIEGHHAHGKDFIIARIITECEGKLYANFYDGHQINRILFRTQPEEGLLHRMKAKNPMNNLTIVGDVHYYVVKAKTAEKKVSESVLIDRSTNVMTDNSSANSIPNSYHGRVIDELPVPKQEGRTRRSSENLEDQTAWRMTSSSASDAGSVKPTTFEAQYYATDDDYLMRRHVRQYFKDNAVNAEDMFIFTLFGASTLNPGQEGFSAPLVSDPTDPHAVALPLQEAIRRHMIQQNQASQNPNDPQSVEVVGMGNRELDIGDVAGQNEQEEQTSRLGWLLRFRPSWFFRRLRSEQQPIRLETDADRDIEAAAGPTTDNTGGIRTGATQLMQRTRNGWRVCWFKFTSEQFLVLILVLSILMTVGLFVRSVA